MRLLGRLKRGGVSHKGRGGIVGKGTRCMFVKWEMKGWVRRCDMI